MREEEGGEEKEQNGEDEGWTRGERENREEKKGKRI